jgi:hydrogenase/urease accessory protein HupE
MSRFNRPTSRSMGLLAALGTVAVLLASPSPAQAHLVQTGFGGFYDGLTHLLITPSDLLLVLGLALLAAQSGTAAGRSLLLALPIGWLAGGWIGLQLPGEPALPVLTTLSFTLVGVLVALQARLGQRTLMGLALLCGGLHGVVNGATMNHGGGEQLALIGTVSGVFVLTAMVSGQFVGMRQPWIAVAVRVSGSWMAAAGLLMLGWLARGSL